MINPFLEHPHSVSMTYREHLIYAVRIGTKAALAGLACIIHGFLPFIFKTALSDTVAKLTAQFEQSRIQKQPNSNEKN